MKSRTKRWTDRVIQIELNGGDDSEPEFEFGHDLKNQNPSDGHPQFLTWKRPAYERLLHHPTISGVL